VRFFGYNDGGRCRVAACARAKNPAGTPRPVYAHAYTINVKLPPRGGS